MKIFLPLILAGAALSIMTGCSGQQSTSDSDAEIAVFATDSDFDNSTPQKAIENFFNGIVNNNLDQVQSATIVSENVLPYLKANISAVRAMEEFATADNKYFGAEGAMPEGMVRNAMLTNIAKTQIVMIDQDHASWPLKPTNPMELVRVNDNWKVDFRDPKHEVFLTLSAETFSKTAKMYDEVRIAITEERLKSRNAARDQMKLLKNRYGL